MAELTQQRDLPYRRAGHTLAVRVEAYLLERDDLSRLSIFRFVHHPVRSFADLLQLLEEVQDSLHVVRD